MADIKFTRGDFKYYRAVTKVHLGAIQDDLQEGEVIQYDGQTMKRGPDEHQISNLRSAIKVGWLVPDEQEGGEYVAQPADIKIHDAQSTGRDRGEARSVGTVADEERDLGTRKAVRDRANPSQDDDAEAKTEVTQDQEGTVVGKIKSPAKAEAIEVGKDDKKVVQNLDNKSKIEVEPAKKAAATGDVEEAIAGEELSDLLPEAASSETPKPGPAGEGKSEEEALESQQQAAALAEKRRRERLAQAKGVETSSGSSSVGGAEDGVVVGKVSTPAAPASEAVANAKIEMLKDFVPGFDYNLSGQWRSRVKKALEYKDNPKVIETILSVETETVQKHIRQGLEG